MTNCVKNHVSRGGLGLLLITVAAAGCGVPKEQHDRALAHITTLRRGLDDAQSQNKRTTGLVDGLQRDLVKMQGLLAKVIAPKACPDCPSCDCPRPKPDPRALYRVPVSAKDPWMGARNPLVTIVAFQDFECPYCKWAACQMKLLVAAYPKDVRVVFKNSPLAFHPGALPAAVAAMAAFKQKGNRGFWAFHDRLYPMKECVAKPPMPPVRQWLPRVYNKTGAPKLDASHLMRIAKEIGLNMGRFKRDIASPAMTQAVQASRAAAVSLGAKGTPSFFINGRYLRGARPFARFKVLIDAEIKRVRVLIRQGRVRRSHVYRAILALGTD